MQFKDAAYEILKKAKQPLHHNEITERALAAGLLETTGKTPHATMGALLYTDTLKPDSRFKRGDQKGTFALKTALPTGIERQIESIRTQVRRELRANLRKMHPQKFEELIRALLEEMGFEETETTSYSGDKGIDVRGVLNVENLSTVRVAIQAKRWIGNVGPDVIQKVRGALKITDAEHGIVITPSDFTGSAKDEARASGKFPISLVNGDQLVDLLIQYQVGVKKAEYIVPEIDEEYWTEIIGISPSTSEVTPIQNVKEIKSHKAVTFPLAVRATHKGQTYYAKLLDIKGKVAYNGQEYLTPTAAAKAIVIGWPSVNGWDFWRYHDSETGEWKKIGSLRQKSNH
jgi:restriction system protein